MKRMMKMDYHPQDVNQVAKMRTRKTKQEKASHSLAGQLIGGQR
jgi:hypothetical protein